MRGRQCALGCNAQIPRVFHLKLHRLNDTPNPAHTLAGRRRFFNEGNITPTLYEEDYRAFKKEANCFGPDELSRRINAVRGGPQIKLMIETIRRTYEGEPRKSGNMASSHELRAMYFALLMQAADEVVFTAGSHDWKEHRFIIVPSTDGGSLKLSGQGMDDYIGSSFGARVLKNDTRLTFEIRESIKDTPYAMIAYLHYLTQVWGSLVAAWAKAIDATINLFEFEGLSSQEKEDAIIKAAWQLKWLEKFNVDLKEIVRYAIEENAIGDKYAGLKKWANSISRIELAKFAAGFSLNDSRHNQDLLALLSQVRLSGAPQLDLYGMGPFYEIEAPYLQSEDEMVRLIYALSPDQNRIKKIVQKETRLSRLLNNAPIYSFETDIRPDELVKLLRVYGTKAYDEMLKSGKHLPNFDRNRMVEAAFDSGRVEKVREIPSILIPKNAGEKELSILQVQGLDERFLPPEQLVDYNSVSRKFFSKLLSRVPRAALLL